MSGPRRPDYDFLSFSPKKLRMYLYREGALPTQWDDDEEHRKARRKYRKLVRLARKRCVPLDLLLVRREWDRKMQEAHCSVGDPRSWGHSITYRVKVLSLEKESISPPGSHPYTRPQCRVVIEGIEKWNDLAETPLSAGTVKVVHPTHLRQVDPNGPPLPLTPREACLYNIYQIKDRIDVNGFRSPSLQNELAKWEALLDTLE